MKRIQILEDGRTPAKEAKNWKIGGQKRRITKKEYQRLLNKFEMEGVLAQKGLWRSRYTKLCETEVPCSGKNEMPSESFRQCMKRIS